MQPKKVSFSITDRIRTLNLFDEFRGGMETLDAIQKDLKEVALTDDEKAACDFKVTVNPEGKSISSWSTEKAKEEKEITLNRKTVDYLVSKIKERDAKGLLSLADFPLIALFEKLS